MPSDATPFSPRERAVSKLLHLPNKSIAAELEITEATVKVHVRSILKKLGAHNRTAAQRMLSEYTKDEVTQAHVMADQSAPEAQNYQRDGIPVKILQVVWLGHEPGTIRIHARIPLLETESVQAASEKLQTGSWRLVQD